MTIERTTFGRGSSRYPWPCVGGSGCSGWLLGRALRVDDELERLVLDDDPLGSPSRLLRVLRGDEGDRLAEVAHAVDRQHRLVGELEPVVLLPGHVLVGQDGVDAGHASGRRRCRFA